MRIAILGGSFNPIHNGHLALADCVSKELGFQRILFVPTCIPPHKNGDRIISAEHRLNLVKAAISGDERFVLEPCEVEREGVSYTYDTIQFLKKKYEGKLDGKIGIIMGQELACEFCKWYRWEDLSKECELIVALRKNPLAGKKSGQENVPSGSYNGGTDCSGEFAEVSETNPDVSFTRLKNPLVTVSSTQIRSQIAEGLSWKYLVPTGVFDYITLNRLYGFSGNY